MLAAIAVLFSLFAALFAYLTWVQGTHRSFREYEKRLRDDYGDQEIHFSDELKLKFERLEVNEANKWGYKLLRTFVPWSGVSGYVVITLYSSKSMFDYTDLECDESGKYYTNHRFGMDECKKCYFNKYVDSYELLIPESHDKTGNAKLIIDFDNEDDIRLGIEMFNTELVTNLQKIDGENEEEIFG